MKQLDDEEFEAVVSSLVTHPHSQTGSIHVVSFVLDIFTFSPSHIHVYTKWRDLPFNVYSDMVEAIICVICDRPRGKVV